MGGVNNINICELYMIRFVGFIEEYNKSVGLAPIQTGMTRTG